MDKTSTGNITGRIEKYLRQHQSEELVEHSLATRDYALELNQKLNLGFDAEKVEIAALLHDLAKEYTSEKCLEIADNNGYIFGDFTLKNPKLMHATISAFEASRLFSIDDSSILNAIAGHTIGFEDMSDFDLLIYSADKLEPYRDYPDADELRETIESDFLVGCLTLFERNRDHIVSKGGEVHPKSESAIESLRNRISSVEKDEIEEDVAHEGNGVLSGEEKITFIRTLLSIETWVMVCAVLAVLLTFLGSSIFTIYDQYTHIGHRERNGTTNPRHHPPSYFFDGRTELLFVIAGLDEVENASRTDTLMLAKLDFVHQKMKVISFPRDLYVSVPGKTSNYWDRINGAYTRGGSERLLETMYGMTGFYPDFLVFVDYVGFKNIIDSVGGVEIDVDKNMNYDDNAGNLHIHIKKGQQVLNGEDALGYVRYRQDFDGDFSRMRRQQIFLKALKKAISRPENALRMRHLIVQILDSVNLKIIDSKTEQIEDVFGAKIETTTFEITDKKLKPIQYMALEKVLKNLPNDNISVQTVPVLKEGLVGGKWVLVPDYVQYDIMMSDFLE